MRLEIYEIGHVRLATIGNLISDKLAEELVANHVKYPLAVKWILRDCDGTRCVWVKFDGAERPSIVMRKPRFVGTAHGERK